MKYNYDDLKKCAITKDMMLKWFMECYNEKQGDVWEKDNIDLEVKINGKKLDDPLRCFERVEDYIDKKIDKHCKMLANLDNEINELANKKAKELLVDKVYELENNISEWLDINN